MHSGAGVRVLDLGFGTGVLTEEPYADGCKICGVDFSRRMVGIAQDKMPRAGLTGRLVPGGRWDADEIYLIWEKLAPRLPVGRCRFEKASACAGIVHIV